ncbi:MAG TPA: prolipoprotein diacylglyceryl transferase [Candidatus Saccharimonadia bacterium]|nr:prolipoprotein diacylglyceryl transferase [Candidatus Saccharimonadia bacterium]
MFHLYGLILGIAIVAAWTAIERRATQAQKAMLGGAAVWVVVGGIVGARAYHLITDWGSYRSASVLQLIAVWNGGLGIYGAVIGGVVAGAIYLAARKKLNAAHLLEFLDLIAMGLPLGQAIGRWGNYINHELFGLPTNLPWGIFIPTQFRPPQFLADSHFHPLFFYESAAMLLIWLVIWRATALHKLKIGTGQVFGIYLTSYGAVRFLLDFLRIDRAFYSGVPIGQAVSLAAVLLGIALVLRGSKSVTI